MKKSKYLFVLLLLISISVVLLGGTFFYVKLNNKQSDDSGLLVMTSCNPVYLATINVVGDAEGVTVQNLSQPTTGCLHDYTLTTEDMKNLSKADVLIVNGGGMEGYLEDVVEAYPNLPIIDTFEAVEEDYPVIIEEEDEEEEEDHSHGTSEEHHHDEGTNSHIWMSEEIYAGQVQAIADGLAALDSSNASVYASNADTFVSVMDSQIDNQGLDESLSGANVAVLHEAFAYTAQSLGANIVATMDLDEERQVSAGEVSDFINAINENNVQVVFAEYDYGHAMGELITEQTDAKVVYLETLVHGDYSGLDYITVLNKNYAVIKNSL
ncbi:metal ABC transporter substrate-binding protein [Pseudobutyrivibrio ruminis]|uniref:Zinc transport system substrate-binding protein n=1 Tax=Pseudobutyrivibrio ruminis DSM 9787 TaxID=1123011 RepID=A0A285SF97_9FIRM|nr:metal ABC transporter substrate-binding protein [Pseudobutyrivibrio ruminis]SOC06431.1 zinc transport system substrate-binding protein [Pseudobutyrivibrio ruminis DSM 9787]